jgi:hypothetical protein
VIVFYSSAFAWGTQSAPILLRHAIKLAKRRPGCVKLASYTPAKAVPSGLNAIQIPYRLWWFPPTFGIGILGVVNTLCKALYLSRRLHLSSSDTVVCVGQDHDVLLPFLIRLISGARLIVLLHDAWPAKGLLARLLRFSDVCLPVTIELGNLAYASGARSIKILPPIPSDWIHEPHLAPTRRRSEGEGPVIGLAGSIGPPHVAAARLFSDRLYCISDSLRNHEPSDPGLTVVPRFKLNAEALLALKENCDVLFVYVNPAYYEYVKYGFPSRFLDFLQTGLPVIVVAPRCSAIGQLCLEVRYPLYAPSLSHVSAIEQIRGLISDPDQLAQCREQVLWLARGEFSSDHIHEIFESVC